MSIPSVVLLMSCLTQIIFFVVDFLELSGARRASNGWEKTMEWRSFVRTLAHHFAGSLILHLPMLKYHRRRSRWPHPYRSNRLTPSSLDEWRTLRRWRGILLSEAVRQLGLRYGKVGNEENVWKKPNSATVLGSCVAPKCFLANIGQYLYPGGREKP
jgi:hypothetical protein